MASGRVRWTNGGIGAAAEEARGAVLWGAGATVAAGGSGDGCDARGATLSELESGYLVAISGKAARKVVQALSPSLWWGEEWMTR